jgi:hypothetical protein
MNAHLLRTRQQQVRETKHSNRWECIIDFHPETNGGWGCHKTMSMARLESILLFGGNRGKNRVWATENPWELTKINGMFGWPSHPNLWRYTNLEEHEEPLQYIFEHIFLETKSKPEISGDSMISPGAPDGRCWAILWGPPSVSDRAPEDGANKSRWVPLEGPFRGP